MRQALHHRRRRLWSRISTLFSLLLGFSLWLQGIVAPSAQAIVLGDPGREPVEAVQPGDAEALPATGSYELASVRILGVPAIRVTSPTLALGRGSIDARRRARVIEGNLRMLYRPPQLCSVGERVADTLMHRMTPSDQGCNSWGFGKGRAAASSLRLETRRSGSGLLVIEAFDPSRDQPFPLLTVTAADARFHGTSPEELAEQWRLKLQSRLRQARSALQPDAIWQRLGFTLAAIAALLVLLTGLLWLWSRFRRITTRLRQAAQKNPCTSSFLFAQISFAMTRLLLVLVLVGINAIVALVVLAFPGQTPLGLELLLVPAEVAMKVVLFGALALVLRALDSFLLFQWSGNLDVHPDEQCRREQRFQSLIHITHRLINLACLAGLVIWILSDVPGLSSLSVQLLLAGGAVIGALAIAFQGLLRDFMAGLVAAMEDRFALGDWVDLDGVEGEVVDAGVLSTSLRCLDQRVLVVPNGSIHRVLNHTKLRSGCEVTVIIEPSAASIDAVLVAVRETMEGFRADPDWSPHLLQPPLLRGVNDVTPLGITLSVLLITRAGRQWAAQRELLRRLVRRFQEEGIQLAFLPYPRRPLGLLQAGSVG